MRFLFAKPSLLSFSFLLLLVTSCSKESGCRDQNALNFSASAERDGTCRYTKAIFYAPSNMVGANGNAVTKIEVYVGAVPDQQLIGTIETFNHDVPSACNTPMGAIEYELPGGGVEYLFPTRYYYENGTNEAGSTLSLEATSTNQCQDFRLTL